MHSKTLNLSTKHSEPLNLSTMHSNIIIYKSKSLNLSTMHSEPLNLIIMHFKPLNLSTTHFKPLNPSTVRSEPLNLIIFMRPFTLQPWRLGPLSGWCLACCTHICMIYICNLDQTWIRSWMSLLFQMHHQAATLPDHRYMCSRQQMIHA